MSQNKENNYLMKLKRSLWDFQVNLFFFNEILENISFMG